MSQIDRSQALITLFQPFFFVSKIAPPIYLDFCLIRIFPILPIDLEYLEHTEVTDGSRAIFSACARVKCYEG